MERMQNVPKEPNVATRAGQIVDAFVVRGRGARLEFLTELRIGC